MNAYDYTKQGWVNGATARVALIAQAQETLALLESDRGGDYCQMMGLDRDDAIGEACDFLVLMGAYEAAK